MFSIFGMSAYVLQSQVFIHVHWSQRISSWTRYTGYTSWTMAYNSLGNGQVKRYNGFAWKAINLAHKSRSLSTAQWEAVLMSFALCDPSCLLWPMWPCMRRCFGFQYWSTIVMPFCHGSHCPAKSSWREKCARHTPTLLPMKLIYTWQELINLMGIPFSRTPSLLPSLSIPISEATGGIC